MQSETEVSKERKVPKLLVLAALIFTSLVVILVGFCGYIAIAQPAWVINYLNNLSPAAD